MDIEKLIEELNARGLSNGSSLGYHCGLYDEAATTLSTLQAENEKLRGELESVRAERNAAVEDVAAIIGDVEEIRRRYGVDILGDEYDLDRLRKLVQADKEGRSVVLPSEDAVFRQALETYGPQPQTMMVLEEMAELAKELCKASRGLGSVEHIAEEIADVQIMLEQMIILHQCQGLVDRIRAEKVKRLLERMEKRTDRTATDAPGQRREKVGLP